MKIEKERAKMNLGFVTNSELSNKNNETYKASKPAVSRVLRWFLKREGDDLVGEKIISNLDSKLVSHSYVPPGKKPALAVSTNLLTLLNRPHLLVFRERHKILMPDSRE